MRKTLVSKLRKSGQPRNVICEITGHARESSLDDYDEIDENQRKEQAYSGTLTHREIARANASLGELRRDKEKLSLPVICEFA